MGPRVGVCIDTNPQHEATKLSETAVAATVCHGMKRPSSSSSSSTSVLGGRRLQLLDTIAKVQRQYLQSEGPKVTFGCLLDALLDLMESEYGFIGEVKYEKDENDGDEKGTVYLQTHAITNIAWNAATRAFYEENKESGLKFRNLNTLFGKVMTCGVPVISNAPRADTPGKGIPEGHPPLNCFLGIPFFKKGGEINGMVGIANKPGGYSPEDIEFLEPFTVTCGNLIHGYCQIERNRELISSLEGKVKERTRELESLNQSLEEANKRVMQASAAQLQHFACMSHEIRTPLNCIIGLSSLLEESDLDRSQRESVNMIVKSGDLLLTVVNDLLDYSKLESGNIEMDIRAVSLQDTMNSVVQSIEVQTQTKRLTIQTFLDPTLPEFIQTDSKRLSQILYNLLGNAVKFSHANGRIEVWAELLIHKNSTTEQQEDDKSTVAGSSCPYHVSIMQPPVDENNDHNNSMSRCPFAKNVRPSPPTREGVSSLKSLHGDSAPSNSPILRLKVIDYGKGIEEKDRDRIFKPFSQATAETERVYRGTGLGLAITSKLTKAFGGAISVDSEVGKWTQFTVDLPFLDRPVDLEHARRQLPPDCTAWIVAPPDNPHDHTLQHLSRVCDMYGFPYQIFSNMEEMKSPRINACTEDSTHPLTRSSGSDSNNIDGRYMCIVHADFYHRDTYRAELASKYKCALITFGSSKPCEPEDVTTLHVRSLTRLLPSVLMGGITQLVRNMESTTTTTANTPRRDSLRQQPPSSSLSSDATNKKMDNLASALEPSKSILVAEDNLINQKVLVRMLKRLGINDVDVVNNGEEAVKMEQRKAYDVVLMDMQMPVMDGVEACRKIVHRQEQQHPVPPVIFVTANVSTGFEAECHDAGGAGFLSKPFNIRAIRDVLLAAQERMPN